MEEKRSIEKKPIYPFNGTLNTVYYKHFKEDFHDIVYNTVADLYMQYLIDDFSVELYNDKVEVKVWTKRQLSNFNAIFEKTLQENAFKNWEEVLRSSYINQYYYDISKHDNTIDEISDIIDIMEKSTDYHNFINIEILGV